MTRKRSGGGKTVAVVAVALLVVLLVGAFASLGNKRGETPIYEEYGVHFEVLKYSNDRNFAGSAWTSATYAGGYYIAAVDQWAGGTYLTYSQDGRTWETLDLAWQGAIAATDGVVNELAFNPNRSDRWFFGFRSWNGNGYGAVYCMKSGFQNDWMNVLNLQNYANGGYLTAMKFCGAYALAVDSNGYLYYTSDLSFSRVSETPFFAGYEVIDLAYFDGKYIVLAENATGSYLFTSPSFWTGWTSSPLAVSGNSLYTSSNALLVAADDGKIAYTTDLKSWSYSTVPDASMSFSEIFSFHGKFYSVGADDGSGVLYESNNGVTWERYVKVDEPFQYVSVGTSCALIYGAYGNIYRLTK